MISHIYVMFTLADAILLKIASFFIPFNSKYVKPAAYFESSSRSEAGEGQLFKIPQQAEGLLLHEKLLIFFAFSIFLAPRNPN